MVVSNDDNDGYACCCGEELYITNMKMSKSKEDEVCTLGHRFKPSSWDYVGAHRKITKRVDCGQPQSPDHINENLVTAIPHKQHNHSNSISMLSKQESPSKPNKKRIKHCLCAIYTQFVHPIQRQTKWDAWLRFQKTISL